ncbi:dynamin [Capsaspora owczarzaki ATCC 30864]|uniref:Dynamin-like GTPase OPA1, mitochondrial n=1 Tax=Capsaspora owczarzaki (strain ATCC 30864) TaxID=595528 RepID=A0A0D2X3K3_CAPO3|nr:dynamin [Capsaspora owczarzaki ATCC 30864]KJE94459.1 dynamin, variant [Capsaspora owczarzaki ATCC 30864]|eukprot:XP_004346783.2 dynamin [Capsaspora owczarzaki ATCC 30864]
MLSAANRAASCSCFCSSASASAAVSAVARAALLRSLSSSAAAATSSAAATTTTRLGSTSAHSGARCLGARPMLLMTPGLAASPARTTSAAAAAARFHSASTSAVNSRASMSMSSRSALQSTAALAALQQTPASSSPFLLLLHHHQQQQQQGVRHFSAGSMFRIALGRISLISAGGAAIGASALKGYESFKASLPDMPALDALSNMLSDSADTAASWLSGVRDTFSTRGVPQDPSHTHQYDSSSGGDGGAGATPPPQQGNTTAAAIAAGAAAAGSDEETQKRNLERLLAAEEAVKAALAQVQQLLEVDKKRLAEIEQLQLKLEAAEVQRRADVDAERVKMDGEIALLQKEVDDKTRELMDTQQRLQREIDTLEKSNQELRTSYLHLKQTGATLSGGLSSATGGKRSTIEMYSDVLDLLAKTDKNFSVHDNLPRVVVVGDQSAGKTSVLEMIAQARIFPRGGGEMMTRSPIQVTLSEAPQRRAQFKGSTREYDLTSEDDLAALRNEIESRMRSSVQPGNTVSKETISLSVRGPRMPRMVLVDLPGIISHVTAGMAHETRDDILNMCKSHIHNPNAIILCIQDGSIDAERSSVADVVAGVDPKGERTIFVLTKVDLAEKLNTSPEKIKRILDGRIFQMNALGYFAVITGKGNTEDTIDDIRKYEEDYFLTSKLFKSGALKANQTTTGNLTRAVQKEFWRKVRSSIERQTELIKADLYNKETEWRNTFKGRVMSRDELFQLAKHDILENVATFGKIGAKEWEQMLFEKMWENIRPQVVDSIYLSSARSRDAAEFKTKMDVQLVKWARTILPGQSVEMGRSTLMTEFTRILQAGIVKLFADSEDVFGKLKVEVEQRSRNSHAWGNDVVENLAVIQQNALVDEDITNADTWRAAISFMHSTLLQYAQVLDKQSHELFGPGRTESWTRWTSATAQQKRQKAIRDELLSFLSSHKTWLHKFELDRDELATIRNNVKRNQKLEVNDEAIRDIFAVVYRDAFVKRGVEAASYCSSRFGQPYDKNQAPNDLQCRDVVLFWRVQEMLKTTSKTLRQQVMLHKSKLEREVKQVLETISTDTDAKRTLVTGRRVDLAEQIEVTRFIYQQLEKFISELNKERPQ